MTEPLSPDTQAPPLAAPLAPQDRDVLTLALRAMHPQAIPELIAGDTVADILASVAVAQEAYARARAHSAAPPPVGAGGGGRDAAMGLALDRLSPFEKILRGLNEQ